MEEILHFLQNYEWWVYLVLGIGALFPANQVLQALREWRGASFGLERESARHRFSNALTVLLTLVFLGLVEFVLVSFLLPNQVRSTALATPTLDLLAKPTLTLPAGTRPAVTPTGLSLTLAPVAGDGCIAGKVQWVNPKSGSQIKGPVELKATIQVQNLGFFKYEYSPVGSEKWTTIAADNRNGSERVLGVWNTSQITPGDYLLRLVVADNQNLLLPACVINVRIVSP